MAHVGTDIGGSSEALLLGRGVATCSPRPWS